MEVPQEFKSKITLGFAGFLIAGGVLSLFVGGSIWEPKEGAQPSVEQQQDVPAFGFVPKPKDSPPPAAGGPTW